MASFGGLVMLVVGISILLAMVGVGTTTGLLLGTFGVHLTPTNSTTDFAADTTGLNGVNSAWFLGIFIGLSAIFTIVVGIRAAVGGTFGIAETLKVSSVGVLISLMILDFVAILGMDFGGNIGQVIKIIAIIIYLPITVFSVIAAFDWIGGGR